MPVTAAKTKAIAPNPKRRLSRETATSEKARAGIALCRKRLA